MVSYIKLKLTRPDLERPTRARSGSPAPSWARLLALLALRRLLRQCGFSPCRLADPLFWPCHCLLHLVPAARASWRRRRRSASLSREASRKANPALICTTRRAPVDRRPLGLRVKLEAASNRKHRVSTLG